MKDRLYTIPRFSYYNITKDGRVWSNYSKKWLKIFTNQDGYLYVSLCRKGKSYNRPIHTLLLEAFVSLRPKGMEARHLDDNNQNNSLSNLKWGTHKENMQDTVKHRGRNGGNLKLSESDVRMIIYMWRTGLFTQTEIADVYSVTLSCINHIIDGRNWKQVWSKSA